MSKSMAVAFIVLLYVGAMALNVVGVERSALRVTRVPSVDEILAPEVTAQHVELVGQVGGPAHGVAMVGRYAYLGVGPRILILDMANPVTPVVVGQSAILPAFVEGVAVVEGYAYVADGQAGLRVINVSNPAMPTEVGGYDTPGWAYSVAVAGTYAYVADGNSGLRVINVANPAAPVEVGFCETRKC